MDSIKSLKLVKTNAQNLDFQSLVVELDRYLSITDGDEHDFYHQYNQLDNIKHVILAYQGSITVACGAMKEFDLETMEIKRMFTKSVHRGKGIAVQILNELENWATVLGYKKCILETGKRQVEAIQFYHKQGYEVISNYGQYIGIENSICFAKKL